HRGGRGQLETTNPVNFNRFGNNQRIRYPENHPHSATTEARHNQAPRNSTRPKDNKSVDTDAVEVQPETMNPANLNRFGKQSAIQKSRKPTHTRQQPNHHHHHHEDSRAESTSQTPRNSTRPIVKTMTMSQNTKKTQTGIEKTSKTTTTTRLSP
ncbi:hypothetical protein A2U01_0012804, partial [Trifolium medium]|nr:hypothetical protein [Trifolium medium]